MKSRAPTLVLLAVVAGDFAPLPGFDTTYETVVTSSDETVVKKGDQGKVHATGVVEETGKKFWST